MSEKILCDLCDLAHHRPNIIVNHPNCDHKACVPCAAAYVDGMNMFGMLSSGCWFGNCQQPLSPSVVGLGSR